MTRTPGILATILTLFLPPLHGAVYHVSLEGSDRTGNGSKSKPWRTMGKAAGEVKPGDTVNVGPGLFNEHVELTISGTSEAPITWQGTRGEDAGWLTIVDPSVDASSGWVKAPEIAKGVYKHTKLPFEPGALIVDGRNLESVRKDALADPDHDEHNVAWRHFTLDGDATRSGTSVFSGGPFPHWEGIEGIWGWADNTCYIRFRYGDDPNGKNIRISGNDGATRINVKKAGILLYPAQHNIIRNFHVRGAYAAIAARSADGVGTSHSMIESNYLEHGYTQLAFNGTPGSMSNNVVRYNVLTPNRYGFRDMGAWGKTKPETWGRHSAYFFNKQVYGYTVESMMILLNSVGDNNQIIGNTLSNGFNGVRLIGDALTDTSPATGTIIASNTLHNLSMTALMLDTGHTETHVFNNTAWDFKYFQRWQSLNKPHSYDRVTYVYNNLTWNPPGLGNWVYVHAWPDKSRFFPTIWAYHNTFAGGLEAVNFSTHWPSVGGLPNVRFLNNFFDSELPFFYDAAFGEDPDMLGAFDYNYVHGTASQVRAAWFGLNNIRGGDPREPAAIPISITQTSDLQLIETGLDVSRAFTLRGKAHPPLPGIVPGYFSGAAPALGAVVVPPPDEDDDRSHFVLSLTATSGQFEAPMGVSSDVSDPLQSGAAPSYLSSPQADRGSVTFQFEVPTAGTYVVWCRMLAPSGFIDSIRVSDNGQDGDLYYPTEGADPNTWHWSRVNGTKTATPYGVRVFRFNEGINAIRFDVVDPNLRLSHVVVTDDLDFVPEAGVKIQRDTPVVAIERIGSDTRLRWVSDPDRNYHVFYKDDLSAAQWSRAEPWSLVQGSGAEAEWKEAPRWNTRFYTIYAAP
jgi:hypothetical protein